MAIKKSLLLAGAVTSIGLASITGAAVVGAQSNSSPGNSLAQKIAQKFNLKESDVKAVIDEQHTEMEQQHKQKLEDRLTQNVKDGKITEEQKTKILAKLEELQKDREANREKMKSEDKTERRAFMNQKHAELTQWLKDNNIPEDVFPHGEGHPKGDRRI